MINPGSLIYTKSALDQRELAILESEMRSRSKSLTVSYLLWFFLGILFVHRFYLKRGGGLFLAATLISLFLCFFLIGLIGIFILSIIWLIDAFRMSDFVSTYNNGVEARAITEILASRSGASGAPYAGGYAPAPYAPTPYAPVYAPPAPPVWAPTHRTPAGGMPAWTTPDNSQPPAHQLSGGLDLVLGPRSGNLIQVRASNGWQGWVEGSPLVAISG